MFSLICMVITAPIKNDISNTMPMEFTPSCSDVYKRQAVDPRWDELKKILDNN